MYVDFFACPYDQVLPMSNAQAAGMGDYLSPFRFTTPQYLAAGGRGLGCAYDCGCGMGAFTMDGTGLLGTGLFAGDPSTWGGGEYAVLAAGAFVLYSVVFTSRKASQAVRHHVGRVSSRAKKIKRGFTS